MASWIEIRIAKDEAIDFTFSITDTDGTAQNTEDFSASFQVADDWGGTKKIDLTSGDGEITVGGGTDKNEVTVSVSDSHWSAIDLGTDSEVQWVYSLTLTKSGESKVPARGWFVVQNIID